MVKPSQLKHGPGGTGEKGPCDPQCAKCAAEANVTATMVLRPISEAPKDATEFLAWTTDRYGNRRWLIIHWARGGGEDQPPFLGWFYWCYGGFAGINPERILGWTTLPEKPEEPKKPVCSDCGGKGTVTRSCLYGCDTPREEDL